MATRNSPKRQERTVNSSTQVECQSMRNDDTMVFEVFVEVGRYILLILACVHLLFEVSRSINYLINVGSFCKSNLVETAH